MVESVQIVLGSCQRYGGITERKITVCHVKCSLYLLAALVKQKETCETTDTNGNWEERDIFLCILVKPCHTVYRWSKYKRWAEEKKSDFCGGVTGSSIQSPEYHL